MMMTMPRFPSRKSLTTRMMHSSCRTSFSPSFSRPIWSLKATSFPETSPSATELLAGKTSFSTPNDPPEATWT